MSEYAVIDVETSGLSASAARIIEIGIMRMDESGDVLDEYESLVNPKGPVGAVHIHGITQDMVEDAPVFSEIAGDVLEMIRSSVLVAHNIPFDKSFLFTECRRAGIDIPEIPTLCTLQLSRRLFPGLPSKSLAAMCMHFGIELNHAHRALNDCRAAAKLLLQLKQKGDVARFIKGEGSGKLPYVAPSGRCVKRPAPEQW